MALVHSMLAIFGVLFQFGESLVIPTSFPVRDPSLYTIRYLSEGGNDTENCLSSQPYLPAAAGVGDSPPQYCGSLLYALTGGLNFKSYDKSDIMVLILPGRYSMGERGIEIFYYRNIILSKLPDATGEVVISCDRYLEDNFNNFFVVEVINVFLNELVFTGCGSYSTPVRLQATSNAIISNCSFRNNTNCAFTAHRSEQLLFTNCLFHDNNSSAFYNYTDALDPSAFRFAGGLLISWNSTDKPNASNTATIRNCTFVRNHAVVNVRNANDSRPNFYRPRGHGGAIVLAFEDVTDFSVTIENSRIFENTAVSSGGGIFVSFYDTSTNNKVVITNTSFEGNSCERDGGAISVNTFEIANHNTLIVEDSTFHKNRANVGGGACSFNIQDNLIPDDANLVNNTSSFTSCTFTENSSPTGGSGVNLVSNSRIDQTLATTNFINCTFTANRAQRQGAILSFRFPISLTGSNVFERNEGGGISLMQSRVDVGGTVHFIDNSAMNGGGLALEDQCLIHLLRNSEMYFFRNTAKMSGGALYVRAPSVAVDSNILPIFNTRCFIEYEVTTEPFSLPPRDWKVRVEFVNNTAGFDGAAIHATSIDRCIYTPSLEDRENGTAVDNSIFQLSPQFSFSGNRVINETTGGRNDKITTAPSFLSVEPLAVSGAPGETITFIVSALDQAGNQQPAIWSINEDNENQNDRQVNEFLSLPASGASEQNHYVERVDENFTEICESGLNRVLELSLVQVVAGGVSNTTKASVNVTCCHPGYTFDDEQGLCQIDSTNSIIDRPHQKGRYFYANSNLYVESRNGTLISAVIPPTFQNCTSEGIRPGCLVKFDSPYEQCAQNRSGFLCGRCPVGQGVDLTLRQCRKCTPGDAVILAFVYVAFFVASLLVLFFNIGIPNELKGCLFYIQVVGFVYESSNGIGWDFHLSRLFGFSLYLPLCPYPGYNALGTAGYGVLLSLLSIATIVIYAFSARFSKLLSNRSSVEGIWFLSIITYKYTADTCFTLLRCQRVSGGESGTRFVYYYNGSVECFRSAHLGASIVALVLSVTVVLLFPITILIISYKVFKFTKPFTDVLTNGVKVSCRWWNAFDLFRRLLLIIVVFFFNYVQPKYTQLALFITCVAVYMIFAFFKPYKSHIANLVEALVVIDLVLLTTLFLNDSTQVQSIVRPLSQLLLLLPFILVAIYIALKSFSLIWKKIAPESFKVFCKKMVTKLSPILKLFKNTEENSEIKELKQANEDQDDLADEDEEDLATDYMAYREELLDDNP